MSAIRDLITEHCPDGVEYQSLGEVGTFTRGNGLQKKDFVDEGYPCVHYGQIYTYYGTSATETKSFVAPELAARLKKASTGDLIITTTSENVEDVCTALAWMGDRDVAIGGHSCAYAHSLDPMYAAYYFQTHEFERQKRKVVSGTKVKDIRMVDLAAIRIPVPPLAVQREIASVLEKMERLEAELEAELEARRRQYQHYRDVLLTFERGGAEWLTMGDIGRFVRGRRFTKRDIVDAGLPCINFGEVYTRYGTFARQVYSHLPEEMRPRLRLATTGDVIVTGVSETVEDICKAVAWLGEDDVAVHDDCFAFSHTMDPKFVAYYLQTQRFHSEKAKHVARGKIKRVSAESLSRLPIPVPPRDEQERVVARLDSFDTLVNDLTTGLPAEIASRRKQYEHYRDLLLTFPEKSA